MELFIFIAFQLLMEAQSYKAPAVNVFPDVLSESSSGKMICETPADVTVKQCHFYVNSEQENIKVSQSCELKLTGAEVLIWADVKSPASVDIYCFYIITERHINKPSSHSPAATVTVLGSLQKPIISVSDDDVQINIVCVIPLSVRADFTCSLYAEDVLLHRNVSQILKTQSGEYHHCMFYPSYSKLFTRSVNSRNLSCDYYINTEPEIRSPRSDTHTIRGLPPAKLTASASVILKTDTVQLSCENTEDLEMEMCVFNIKGRESFSELSSSCQLSLTGSQISIWSEGQSSSVRITCFYTVKKSQVLVPSPHSDPVTITIQSLLIIVLVSTGVGVILVGLICLCWFACKKRRRHNKMRSITADEPSKGIGMSSGPAETYSPITSVPATSQLISVGLKHPESHQDCTPDPTATYSSITSEKSIYQPSGVLVNKQQNEGNTEETENVYHLYCTIPDKPVHSKAGDQVFSLANH